MDTDCPSRSLTPEVLHVISSTERGSVGDRDTLSIVGRLFPTITENVSESVAPIESRTVAVK